MLLNPADVYRLINLSSFEGSGNAAGVMALGGDLPVDGMLLWSCLLLWVGVPLVLAYWVFLRRPT
ncbi:hypothetical protein D3C80_2047460 [compost metagenome]